jgi:nitrogen fixation NifU-like protein
LDKPDLVAQEANASCGDLIEFQIKVIKIQSSLPRRQAGEFRVKEIAWRGVGCAISTAAASLLSEKIRSKEYGVKKILELTDDDIVEMLGGDISPTRLKCATLSLKALKGALTNAKI